MNKITRRILEYLLKNGEAWDKKTGKLRVHWVQDQILSGREALWYQEIYFPQMKHLTGFYRWAVYPELEWFEEDDMGWMLDDEDLSEWLINEFEEYFKQIWDGEDWGYEEISEEEMLSLGINPGNIAIQQTLF